MSWNRRIILDYGLMPSFAWRSRAEIDGHIINWLKTGIPVLAEIAAVPNTYRKEGIVEYAALPNGHSTLHYAHSVVITGAHLRDGNVSQLKIQESSDPWGRPGQIYWLQRSFIENYLKSIILVERVTAP